MKAVRLHAEWDPKPEFSLGLKDVEKKHTYTGNLAWRHPEVAVESVEVPKPGYGEVLIEVKACGICGSDVHMAQHDEDGYILYPGLTGFPCTLGHEMSGVVREAGENAFDKTTNRPFQGGEMVCVEEMIWCGSCRPCVDGWPNHCERLNEIGFNINGAFAGYIVLPAKVLWNLESLKQKYTTDQIVRLGSLIEPLSVAYNAVIERGGGIHPGSTVVVVGGGPIGLSACAVLKMQGAAEVILSEPETGRAEIGLEMGADHVVNPLKESLSEKVLEITKGMGASLFLEASGASSKVFPDIEKILWDGRTLNSTVVIVARSDAKIPITAEVLQVRRAQIVGAQGHSGHGTFPRVIRSIAGGMNVLPMISKEIHLDDVPQQVIALRTNRSECKITCIMDGRRN